MSASRLTPETAKALLNSVDYILLDIDGVLWSGDHVFDGVPETLQWLRKQGKQVRFLSNNATMSRTTMAKKFIKRGLEGVTTSETYTSAYAAALQLKKYHGGGAVNENVLVVGEQGLHDEIRAVLAAGFYTYGLELNNKQFVPNELSNVMKAGVLPPPSGAAPSTELVSLPDLKCTTVVAGLDLHLNMYKLAIAGLVLQQPNVRFVATNEDPQYPVGKDGLLVPGAGTGIAALSTVGGRAPDIVCGKPHLHMAKLLFERENIKDPRRCLMIGDRLSTDIAFGNGAGCQTMLVLTGCEGPKEVAAAQALGGAKQTILTPNYIADSLNALRLLAVHAKL
jgi:4-nitrophenyl phosphatase